MHKDDILSEVFSTLRIRSDLYFRAQLGGRSAVRVPAERRRIRFHLVLRGTCLIEVEGAPPVEVSEGDIALIPDGASQVVSLEPEAAAVALEDLVSQGALREGILHAAEEPATALLLCGFCRFDESVDHPVLAALPPLIHLRMSDLGAEPWVATTLRLLALEADRDTQGTTAILGRLIEIVVIQATRRLTTVSGGAADGFVAALSDASLSRALLAMHRSPEKAWRVGDLARCAGMSRSRFADRFARTVGMPPMTYLTDWRLLKARALLHDTGLSIDEIAERCGYASVPSFSRRFKSRFGAGPGAFRRLRAGEA